MLSEHRPCLIFGDMALTSPLILLACVGFVHASPWLDVGVCLFQLIQRLIEEVTRLYDRLYGASSEWKMLKEHFVALCVQLKRTVAQFGSFLAFLCREIGTSVWRFLISEEMVQFVFSIIRFLLYVMIQLLELGLSPEEPLHSRVVPVKCGPLMERCHASCQFLGSCDADPRRACRKLSGLWHPDHQKVKIEKKIAQGVFIAIRTSCDSYEPCLSLKRLFVDEMAACGKDFTQKNKRP